MIQMTHFTFLRRQKIIYDSRLIIEECGFKLHMIELLNIAGEVKLAQSNPDDAVKFAEEAFKIATKPSCSFTWGMGMH